MTSPELDHVVTCCHRQSDFPNWPIRKRVWQNMLTSPDESAMTEWCLSQSDIEVDKSEWRQIAGMCTHYSDHWVDFVDVMILSSHTNWHTPFTHHVQHATCKVKQWQDLVTNLMSFVCHLDMAPDDVTDAMLRSHMEPCSATWTALINGSSDYMMTNQMWSCSRLLYIALDCIPSSWHYPCGQLKVWTEVTLEC